MTTRRKYRTKRNTKIMKQLSMRAPEDVHTFFEVASYDEKGRKLSKLEVLEQLITIAGPKILKSNRV